MNSDFSRQSLLAFLDYERDKGLVKGATISSRKASVNAVFAILSPEENQDVRELDVEEAITRLANKRGADFTPDTLAVYKSRVSTAIRDFLEYRKNPAGFKTVTNSKPSRTTNPEKRISTTQTEKTKGVVDDGERPDVGVAFPVPLRPGVVVKLVGIPSDMSKREAMKISAIVMALVQTED